MLAFWFVMHIILVAFFKSHFSLLTVTLFHTMINMWPQFIWVFDEGPYADYATEWHQTSVLVLVPAVAIWAFVKHRRAKKAFTENV